MLKIKVNKLLAKSKKSGERLMRIISFTNQKGGVAKSTSTINAGAILGQMGRSVLVVDIDPQANTTVGLGIDAENLDRTIYECLAVGTSLREAVLKTQFKNVDIVPSNIRLANAELEIASVIGRESILKDLVRESSLDYDYMLIDFPPSLGLLTINGLAATGEVIIPIDVGLFSLVGISLLTKKIYEIKAKLNPSIKNVKVLLTRVDSRTNFSKTIKKSIEDIFGDNFFTTVIHQNVKISEAQSARKPVSYFDKNCRGTIEYKELAKEIEKGQIDAVKI